MLCAPKKRIERKYKLSIFLSFVNECVKTLQNVAVNHLNQQLFLEAEALPRNEDENEFTGKDV